MKSSFKYFFLILFVCFILSSSCSKNNVETVTINGMTFGCRVDGVPFIPDLWDYGNNIPPVRIELWYSPVGNYHYLIAKGVKSNEYVEIYLNPPLVVGRRELKFNTRPYPIETVQKDYGLYQKINPDKEYITNETLGGFVDIISVDTINLKIEGRFEFTGTEKTTGTKVTVTNGYFKNF